MVNVRKNKKGAKMSGRPNYYSKSRNLTIALHLGGTFNIDAPKPEYEGGKILLLDWCKVDELSLRSLDPFCVESGITGDKRFYLQMNDNSYKLLIDDSDLRKWARDFLSVREMHVFVELLDLDDSEDPDYKGKELAFDDDKIFYEEVECLEGEFDDIDPSNIIIYDDVDPKNGICGETSKTVEGEESNKTVADMEENMEENYSSFEEPVGQEISDDDISEEEVEKQAENCDDVDGSDSDEDSSDSDEDVVDSTKIFDEGKISDEDDDDLDQYPSFNPKEKFKPEFVLRQVFLTKQEFKFAAQSHAINQRRNITFIKNDGRRVYVRCASKDCKWMINALNVKKDSAFQIRKLLDRHTCAPSHKVKAMTSTWLSERFLQRFQSDGSRSVKGFLKDAMHDTRCEISRTQAYKAKTKALAKIEGDPDAQYAKLWSYAEELRKTNPGSTVIVDTEVNNGVALFRSFYCCFHALKTGFKTCCRKLIGVDGCFLKGKHGGMLLSAVGVDANNNPFPVAYAVVERENQEIWEWFLTVLKTDLGINSDEYTFMSDKQKGLIGAMETVFPGIDQRFCARHLHCNLKVAGFRGLAIKKIFCKAANSTTEGMFKEAMDEMKKESQGAWEWLNNKPPQQWSKAYFSEKAKCDMLLNNVCETFNSNILEARDKSIITMLEWIRESLLVRLQKNRDRAAAKWKGVLCPRIQKILNTNTEKVVDCRCLKASDWDYQISCFDGGQFTVDLKKETCSCRAWQLTGIPCTHGICALLRQKLDPLDYVDKWYTVETYKRAYELPILGVSYDLLWGESMYIPPLPPNFGKRARRGRKPLKRRLEPFELKERKSKEKFQKMRRQAPSYKCRKCGKEGHNIISCGKKESQTEAAGSSSAPPRNEGVTQPVNSTGEHIIAPPMRRPAEDNEMMIESQITTAIGTQQSQITTEKQKVHGPTVYEQLLMGRGK